MNENKNEETMTNEEIAEMIAQYVNVGAGFYNKTKKSLVQRGFILGLTSAIAVQSVITIIVMLINR